ncbi:MAG: nitrous oxide reductase family maturation protein NosD [Promethearchaeota archaeon]
MCKMDGVVWKAVGLTFILVLGGMALAIDLYISDPESAGMIPEPGEGAVELAGTPHGPIVIDGDANFTATVLAEGWAGNGTSEDPYIIESLSIDLGGAIGSCIEIRNTLVHFIVRDCHLTGARGSTGAGFSLRSVTNGRLVHNNCSGNMNGIYLKMGADNNTISNNTCTSNIDSGVLLEGANYNTLSQNNVTGSEYGLLLNIAHYNTMVANVFNESDTCVMMVDASYNTFAHNMIGRCVWEAIRLVSEPAYNLFTNNTIADNEYGMYLDRAANNSVIWNIFLDNWGSVTIEELAVGNIFDYNFWSDYSGADADGDGIGDAPYMYFGPLDVHPLMYLPTPPIWVESPIDQNIEFGPYFFRFDLNVTSHAPLNWWVNDTVLFTIDSTGLVRSTAYLPIGIYGLKVVVTNIYLSELTADFYVWVRDTIPPAWMIAPTDQTLEYGEGIDYQVAVIDLSGIEHWELSDTVHFTLTTSDHSLGSTAHITNATTLEPGVRYLQITAYDPYDNFCTATITVRVLEGTDTTTTTTTTTFTSTDSGAIDPAMTFVIGIGVGGVTVIVIVLAVLRRPVDE